MKTLKLSMENEFDYRTLSTPKQRRDYFFKNELKRSDLLRSCSDDEIPFTYKIRVNYSDHSITSGIYEVVLGETTSTSDYQWIRFKDGHSEFLKKEWFEIL